MIPNDLRRYDPALTIIYHVPGDGLWPLPPAVRTSKVRTDTFTERVDVEVLGHTFVYYEEADGQKT